MLDADRLLLGPSKAPQLIHDLLDLDARPVRKRRPAAAGPLAFAALAGSSIAARDAGARGSDFLNGAYYRRPPPWVRHCRNSAYYRRPRPGHRQAAAGATRSVGGRAQAVADPADGLDVARRRRVRLEFAAQVLDVRVDSPLVAGEVVPLHAVDQLEARVHAAGILRERQEELDLGG